MNTILNNIKWVPFTLSIFFLLQSCKVYQGKTVTKEEAIISANRVMVKNYSNESYKFELLLIENDILYGITKKKSITAKKLSDQILDKKINNKYVKIILPEESNKEYHLQNKTLSTILTIAIPLAVVAIAVGILSDSMKGNSFCVNLDGSPCDEN